MQELTTIINLLALAVSLWLGFYIITRSPYRVESRLATLMLWTLDTYFLCNALLNNLPGNIYLAWLQQMVVLVLPLTLHLTVRLLPEERVPSRWARLNRIAVPAAYVIAGVLVVLGVLPSNPPVGLLNLGRAPAAEPLALGRTSPSSGPLYPAFVLFLVAVSILSLVNLWKGREQPGRPTLDDPYTTLFVAAALAFVGGLYSGLGTWLQLGVPTFPADILYGIAIVLVGYTVARHAALLEGRPMDRDFLYSILVVGSLTAFYFLIALVLYVGGQVSLVTLILTIVGTIAANSLFDGVRIALDRWFYRAEFQKLRGNLRALASEAGTSGTLSERLQAILVTVCRVYRIRQGLIALREDDHWTVKAAHEASAIGPSLPQEALAATESTALLHADKKGLPGMVLLIPLYAGASQLGALVLGAKENRRPYDEAELEFLEGMSEEIAGLIHAVRLQEENVRTIDTLVEDFRNKERALQLQMQRMLEARAPVEPAGTAVSEESLLPQVEQALRRLHDFAYLGEQPLARLRIVDECLQARGEPAVTSIERGKALSEVLVQALNELRPDGPAPGKTETPSREWHPFIILHDSYVADEPNRDIMSRLYIGEGTFNRMRRRALRSVAKSLAELEHEALSAGN